MIETIERLTGEALESISCRDYASALEALEQLVAALEVGEASSLD